MSDFPAVHHVALTVTDLDESREWYARLFGIEPAVDEPVGDTDRHEGYRRVLFALPNGGIVALHKHPATDPADGFSEFMPGLDHLGFFCPSRADLDKWRSRLDELGIEHAGINEDAVGCGLAFRDPDNIQLELWAPRD